MADLKNGSMLCRKGSSDSKRSRVLVKKICHFKRASHVSENGSSDLLLNRPNTECDGSQR